MLASRIERVEPERVLLTSRRTARIRVQGYGHGWLRCGAERRWVWGRFDHSFVLRSGARQVALVLVGLTGWTRRQVDVPARCDFAFPAAPRPVRLQLRLPRAPRTRPLSRADLARSEERRG